MSTNICEKFSNNLNIAELGVSTNPCSDTFCGDRAFSEVETANIRDYVLTISPVPTFGTAVHSAAELWLYPYGYDYNQFPDNVEEHVSGEYQIMFLGHLLISNDTAD